jgi:hypothetical protein
VQKYFLNPKFKIGSRKIILFIYYKPKYLFLKKFVTVIMGLKAYSKKESFFD